MGLVQRFRDLIVLLLQGMIWLYRMMISPMIGPRCRFHPTCSCYAHEALGRHGICKGIYLSLRRILSCHPWSSRKGDDPVPDQFAWRDILRYKHTKQI
jgi:uncharacterized protein